MKTQSSQSLLEALRLHTHSCHQALEKKFDVFHRIQNEDAYGSLLLTLYGFYNEIEPRLARWASDFARLGLDFEIRRKISNLLADISALDLNERLASQPSSEVSALPDLRNLSQAVGCLYVLEGSTLGAQIICQHLRSVVGSGGRSGPLPMAFYQGYGPETRKMWGEFCDFLFRYSQQMKSPQEREQVLASARQTFESLGECLGFPYPSGLE